MFTSDLPEIEFQDREKDWQSEERGISTFGASLGGLGSSSMETDTTMRASENGEVDDGKVASLKYDSTQGSANA